MSLNTLTNLTKFESVHYLDYKYHLKHLVLRFLFEVEMASNKAVRKLNDKRPKVCLYRLQISLHLSNLIHSTGQEEQYCLSFRLQNSEQ